MKTQIRNRILVGILMVVLVPMVVSLLFFRNVSVAGYADYISQGGLLALVLGLPFILVLKSKYWKVAGIIFCTYFIWGVWRLLYFDPVTENDIPGAGYIVAPVMYSVFGLVIFKVRRLFATRNGRLNLDGEEEKS